MTATLDRLNQRARDLGLSVTIGLVGAHGYRYAIIYDGIAWLCDDAAEARRLLTKIANRELEDAPDPLEEAREAVRALMADGASRRDSCSLHWRILRRALGMEGGS